MIKLKQYLTSSKFVKSVILISGGTAFAQGINAIFSLIIARIYSPEEYGILTLYVSILSIISIAGSLRYEYAIPIVNDDEKAINLVVLSIIVLIILTTVVSLVLLLFSPYLFKMFHVESISKYALFVPVGMLLTGFYNIFYQWAFRKQHFKQISSTKIHQSLYQNIMAVCFGFLKFGPSGLIGSRIVGQSAGIITLGMSFFKLLPNYYNKIHKSEILWSAKRYKHFPIYSAPGQILNIAGIQLPVFLISSIFGNEVIGLFGLANSIVNIPMTIIGRSVADVFYSEAACIGKTNPNELKKISEKLLKKLIVLGFFPFIILITFGPNLFTLAFGVKWKEAGIYGQIIAILVYARFVFVPISNIFMVFEKQKESLQIDVLRVILVLFTFGNAKYWGFSPYLTVFIYAISMAIIYLITYFKAGDIITSAIKDLN